MNTRTTRFLSGMIGLSLMLAASTFAQTVNYPLQLSQRYQFPVYTSRTAATEAGINPGAFNAAMPIKTWADPGCASPICSYMVADPSASTTGYQSMIVLPQAQAASYNLPGQQSYPTAPAPAPCTVQEYGPTGAVNGPFDASGIVATPDDAAALVNRLAPLYPKAKLSVIEENQQGVSGYYFSYGANCGARKELYIYGIPGNTGVVIPIGPIENLIEQENVNGIGAPGSWQLVNGALKFVFSPAQTQAPANAVTLPIPIQLQAGETLQMSTGVLPGANRLQVVNAAAQISALSAQFVSISQQILALGGTLPTVQ